ncbi:MAG: hypothetical protein AAF138_04605 [Planctomycetota bacterium]
MTRTACLLALSLCAWAHAAEPVWHPLTEKLGDQWSVVVHADDASRLLSDAESRPMREAIARADVLADSRAAWNALARRLELSPEDAFAGLVGRRTTLVLGERGRWLLRVRLESAMASRLTARLSPAPRKSIGGRPVFAVEDGRYWLTLEPAGDGARSDDRVAHIAPAAAEGWLNAVFAPPDEARDVGASGLVRLNAVRAELAITEEAPGSARLEGLVRAGDGEPIAFAAIPDGREGARRGRLRFAVALPGADHSAIDPADAEAATQVAEALDVIGVLDEDGSRAVASWAGVLGPVGLIDGRAREAIASAGVRAVGWRVFTDADGRGPVRLLAVARVDDVSTATRAGDLALDAGVSRWLSAWGDRAFERAGFDGSAPEAVRGRSVETPSAGVGLFGERMRVSWCYAWEGDAATPPRAAGWLIATIGPGAADPAAMTMSKARLAEMVRSAHSADDGPRSDGPLSSADPAPLGTAWIRPARAPGVWRRGLALGPESLASLEPIISTVDRLGWQWSPAAEGGGWMLTGAVVLSAPEPASDGAGERPADP